MENAKRFQVSNFLRGFLRGLNSPAELYRPRAYSKAYRSPQESMRGDWTRIGNDFRTVMSRVHGKSG